MRKKKIKKVKNTLDSFVVHILNQRIEQENNRDLEEAKRIQNEAKNWNQYWKDSNN